MNKPILLIPDRHWDVLSREALLFALPMLYQLGYDTYCYEISEEASEECQLLTLEKTIKSLDHLRELSEPHFKRCNITFEELIEKPIEDLAEILQQTVTSTKSKEFAMWFKELPAHRVTLKILNKMLDLGGSIRGVDLANNQDYSHFESLEHFDISKKVSSVIQKEAERVPNFVNHTLRLQSQGNGVILVVGMVHYENLLKEFAKYEHLSELVVLFPHTDRCYSRSFEDRVLHMNQPNLTKNLALLNRALETVDQAQHFAKEVEDFLRPIIANFYRNAPNCMPAKILESKLGISLVTKFRPSMYVDGFHLISEDEDELLLTEKLSALGIFAVSKICDNKKLLMIPCINSPDVVKKLKQ